MKYLETGWMRMRCYPAASCWPDRSDLADDPASSTSDLIKKKNNINLYIINKTLKIIIIIIIIIII